MSRGRRLTETERLNIAQERLQGVAAGDLATRLASNFSPEERRALDAKVAAWKAQTPDPAANEVASAQ